MYNLFYGCSSLKNLPDISKWNTNKLIDIGCIFKNCSSLSILPDISKWNTNKIKYIDSILDGCSSLISLPDISKWYTLNIKNKKDNIYNDSSHDSNDNMKSNEFYSSNFSQDSDKRIDSSRLSDDCENKTTYNFIEFDKICGGEKEYNDDYYDIFYN